MGIVLLALVLVGLTAALSQREFSKHLETAEHTALVNSVHGLAEHLRADILERLRQDVMTLSMFPSLLALAEQVGSTTGRQRATDDIASFLRANPDYLDVLLISTLRPGRQLLHVDQYAHTPIPEVGADDTAINLADSHHYRIGRGLAVGQTYLSGIELRREDGRILKPFQPVMHAIAPLRDIKGKLLGVLLVQLDLSRILNGLQAGLRQGQSLYLFDSDGHCLSAPATISCGYGFEFPGSATDPELPHLLPAVHRESDFREQDEFSVRDVENSRRDVIAAVVRLPFDSRQTQRRVTVAVTAPYASALASAAAARAALLPMLIIVALITVLLAILVAGTLTRPLRRMTASVRAFAEKGEDLPLPTEETNEIGTLARAFESMRDEVRARAEQEADNRANEVLIKAKAAAELDAKEARALATLLRLSLQPLPMNAYLQASIDTLLDSVPWLALLPMGAIFLEKVGAAGTAPELVLAAERNLSPPLLTLCARVPHGKCLCGRAAATREIQFAHCLDARHEILFDNIAPHGHYNLPILHGEALLGVLVLYLPHDYQERGGERRLLTQVTDVLALGIAARHTHESLEEALAHAEAGARAKSEFLATISHEIRTPMNGILGMTQLLAQSELTPEQEEFVQTILQSGNALLATLNDILDFSKIEAGRLEIRPLPFDLEHSIRDTIHLLAARAREKGLELRLRYAPDCPRQVVGDASRIREVLLNLLGNAIKFTEAGHIETSVEYPSRDKHAPSSLRIGVRDTGIGISPAGQTSLFQPFSQADASHTRKYGGTGLGLAISKRLVELMGGTIGVESEVGRGSTFWFTLPLPTTTVSETQGGATQVPALSNLAHLDRKPLDEFRSQLGEDFAMLVDTFLESTPLLLNEISSALAAGDTAALHRHAHSLKSSAATYGAMYLSAMARALEQDAAVSELANAAAAIAALRVEYEAVAAELRSYADS